MASGWFYINRLFVQSSIKKVFRLAIVFWKQNWQSSGTSPMNDLSLQCVFVNCGCTISSNMSISTEQKKVVGGFGMGVWLRWSWIKASIAGFRQAAMALSAEQLSSSLTRLCISTGYPTSTVSKAWAQGLSKPTVFPKIPSLPCLIDSAGVSKKEKYISFI